MGETEHPLEEDSPLITAAHLGKLRLVRLLVEGGAQVNERNQRGETPLLAACKALSGSERGSGSDLKLLLYLLENHADPNSQDKAGRTALMYSCMARAGPEVATALIKAGADPSLQDYAGASSLVYAINSRDQATLQVLLDACREGGRDIIIITTTKLNAEGTSITRPYLNVIPSPDSSPVSCTSPSDIELKASPTGSEAEGGGTIFNFRASGNREDETTLIAARARDQQLRSEPCLAIPNLGPLRTSCVEGLRSQAVEQDGRETVRWNRRFLSPDLDSCNVGRRWSLHASSAQGGSCSESSGGWFCPGKPSRGTSCDRLPHTKAPLPSRRNTLAVLEDQTLLHLPSLPVASLQPQAPHPPEIPDSGARWKFQEHLSPKSSTRISFLPPLSPSPAPLLLPPCPPQLAARGEQRGRRLRHDSIQLEKQSSEDILI